jgi:hypothetical protein
VLKGGVLKGGVLKGGVLKGGVLKGGVLMRAPFCSMPRSCVKSLQDGPTKHTHEITWRCVAIVGFDALFFCKIVARWVYLYTRTR